MGKIIYRTGAQLRAENQKYNPELFDKDIPPITKLFFRGEPIVRLLNDTDYNYFLRLYHRTHNIDASYYLTQQYITKKRLAKEKEIDRHLSAY